MLNRVEVCLHPGPLTAVCASVIPSKTVVQCPDCTSMRWESSNDLRIQHSIGNHITEPISTKVWPCAPKAKKPVAAVLSEFFVDELSAVE